MRPTGEVGWRVRPLGVCRTRLEGLEEAGSGVGGLEQVEVSMSYLEVSPRPTLSCGLGPGGPQARAGLPPRGQVRGQSPGALITAALPRACGRPHFIKTQRG